MNGEERPAFLDSHCASDPSLRIELNELLAAEGELGSSFLEKPAIGQAHSVSSAGGSVLPPGAALGSWGDEWFPAEAGIYFLTHATRKTVINLFDLKPGKCGRSIR